MPLNLLREIASQPLPWAAGSADEIEKVRLLRSSGHAAAFVSAPGSAAPYARVLALTPKGREALRHQQEIMELATVD